MFRLLEKYSVLRNAPDGGEGGGGGDPTPDPNKAPPPEGDGQPAGSGEAVAAASADQPYAYEGVPDHMLGKDAEETLDNVNKALKGYRDKDATAPKAPENADEYKDFKLDDLPEEIRGHIGELANDPLFQSVAEQAHELNVPTETLHKLTAALYGAGQEVGLFDAFVDSETERSLLIPNDAKDLPKDKQDAAIDARMQANIDRLDLISTNSNGELPAEVAEHAKLMLVDTAQGHHFLEYVIGKIQGTDSAQPKPGGGSGAGDLETRKAALRNELAKPEMKPSHPKFDKAKAADLDRQYQELYGK